MTALLLDTNAVFTLAQAPSGTVFPGVSAEDSSAVSAITELELRLGRALAPRDAIRTQTLLWLTDRYVPLPVDARVTKAFTAVAEAAVAAGQHPRKCINDLTIAATALAHGAVLLTDDKTLRNALAGLVPTRSLLSQ